MDQDPSFSKYDPKNAPVEKNGGNTPIQDGIAREESPSKFYGKGDPRAS